MKEEVKTINSDGNVIALKIPSRTQLNVTHTLTINKKTKTVQCTCWGFIRHGRCSHTRFYRDLIYRTLYGDGYYEKTVFRFNSCSELVQQICSEYPECIGNYNNLVLKVWEIQDKLGQKRYSVEYIDRSYRKLVEEKAIQEPEERLILKKKTEQVMRDINLWRPKLVSGSSQTVLVEGETW